MSDVASLGTRAVDCIVPAKEGSGTAFSRVACGTHCGHFAPMKTRLIVSDPEILSGTPVFSGTRVPVKNLTDCLEAGYSIDDFLEIFPR